MHAELETLLELVVDPPTFFAFIDAPASDFAGERRVEDKSPSDPCGRGALKWENGSIDAFFGCRLRVGTSTVGDSVHDTTSSHPWRRFAEILYADKYYE